MNLEELEEELEGCEVLSARVTPRKGVTADVRCADGNLVQGWYSKLEECPRAVLIAIINTQQKE
jgi:hypothetical protein